MGTWTLGLNIASLQRCGCGALALEGVALCNSWRRAGGSEQGVSAGSSGPIIIFLQSVIRERLPKVGNDLLWAY